MKPFFLKIFLVILVTTIITVFGYAGWLGKVENEKLLKIINWVKNSKDPKSYKDVKELLNNVYPDYIVTSDGKVIGIDGTGSVLNLVTGEEIETSVAVEEFRKLGENVVPILIEIFKTSSNEQIKKNIIYILSIIKGDKATEFLVSVIHSKTEDPVVRIIAIISLTNKTSSESYHQALISISMSNDENFVVQKFAKRKLETIYWKIK